MNIAKTGAAFGLAALTLASSLTLGAQANAAPAKESKTSASKAATPTATMRGKLITPLGNGQYHYVVAESTGASHVGPLAQAVGGASVLTLPARGSSGTISTSDGLCLGVDTYSGGAPAVAPYMRASADCNRSSGVTFGWDASGNLTNATYPGYKMASYGLPMAGSTASYILWTRSGTLKPAPEYLGDYVAPITVSATKPDVEPGKSVQVTVSFSESTTGKLKFTAPKHTTIEAVNHNLCTISADKRTADCGTESDSWVASRLVTLKVDEAAADDSSIASGSELPDGKIEVIKGGVTQTVKLTAKLHKPADVATTQGVYNMSVTPDQGTTFRENSTGKVSFDSQPTSGGVTLPLATGQSYSWTTTLPTGLDAGTLPADNDSGQYWRHTWAKATSNGKTTVTHTITRKSGADGSATNWKTEFPVVAKAGLADNAQVATAFTPPAGYTSSSSTGTANVRVDTTQIASMGVYNHRIDSIVEGTFRPGRTGMVKFDTQPTANSTPVRIRTNESLTWTTSLPAGLKPIDLPDNSSSAYWRHTWTETTTAGTTTVTHTVTRLAGDDDNSANWGNEFRVVSEAGLADGARVSTSVTLPAGYASASANGASTVKSAPLLTATLGIHDHSVKPDQGTVFRPSTVGHVDMKSNASSDATGVWMTTGETLTYTTALPTGLRPGTLPTASSEGGFDHTWASSTANGVTSVTHTIKRTGSGSNVTTANFPNRFEVVAEASLTDGAAVTTTFTPPTGFASANASRTSTVRLENATTMGIHDQTVKPDQSEKFTIGSTGKVTFNRGPAQNATGMKMKAGDTAVWTTVLPKGLNAGTLPRDNATAYWRDEFIKSESNGVTTVTHTLTRLRGEDEPGITGLETINVVAADGLVDGAQVTSTFTPAAGYASGTPSASTPVSFEAEEDQSKPFDVTTPTENQVIVNTTGEHHFEGHGTVGATVSARSQSNKDLGTGTVNEKGEYSFSGWRKIPADYVVTLTQKKAGQADETKVVKYTYRTSPGATLDYKITGPTNGSTIVDKDGHVVITGEGKTGTRVKAVSQSNSNLGTAEVDDNGKWKIEVWRKVPAEYRVTVTHGTGATAQTANVTYTLRLTDKVNNPFEVTAGNDGATYTSSSGVVQFEGKGKAGSTISIYRTSGATHLNDVTVENDGTWVKRVFFPRTGVFNVVIKQDGGEDVAFDVNIVKQ